MIISMSKKKNYIKLNLTLQPNTLEGSKLLTITMIDYSETLIEDQLKNITQSIFNNFEDILIKTVPLTKNCESIIIDSNINVVFDFWAAWKIADIGDELVSELKMDGDPHIVGTKLNYKYFKKYALTAIVEEVNSFVQEGNEDDNNEWNYKYKVIFQNGQSETLNCVFVSCENGSKTWVSAENDINDKIGIAKLQELSQRKLIILTSMKNYIEKNIEFSNMLKTYIVNEAIKNPNNYLNIDETINDLDNIHNNMNSEENPEFILSILGKCIQENGTQTYISKTKDKKINDIDLSSIQSFISFGKEKKYEIHFDFGEEENNKIINNEDKRNNFLKFWKEKIARELKINQNNIILTNVNYGSVSVDATIVNEPKEKNNLLLTLKGKKNIKNVKEKPIFEVLQISPEILDSEGDRKKGWGINEKRGGEDYIPPLDGWFGIGLKVKGKYDNGDDSWLDYKNRKGEFAIAYLGINNFLNEKDIIIGDLNNISRDINEQTSSYINERIYIDEDNLRKSSKYIQCGEGICLFQNPKYAENYAGIVDLYGYRIKIMLMCRVNSEKIRQPKNCPECWILNPTSDEVRPYRILIKVFENSPLTWSSNNEIIVSVSPIKYIISAIKTDNESFYKLEKDKRFGAYLTINKQKIEKEFFAIRLYSSNYYVFINEYLRSEKILDKIKRNGKDMQGFSESEINSWVHCLYLALRNNKNVRNGTVVYRGISKYRFPSEIGIGSKFYIREFVSTSLKKKIAEQFMNYNNNKIGGTLMKITIKNNGVNGHPNYCYHIKGISCYKEEDEILISAHCYYSVTNIERTGHFDYVNITCEGFLLE